jgi:hypothetical protein
VKALCNNGSLPVSSCVRDDQARPHASTCVAVERLSPFLLEFLATDKSHSAPPTSSNEQTVFYVLSVLMLHEGMFSVQMNIPSGINTLGETCFANTSERKRSRIVGQKSTRRVIVVCGVQGRREVQVVGAVGQTCLPRGQCLAK